MYEMYQLQLGHVTIHNKWLLDVNYIINASFTYVCIS